MSTFVVLFCCFYYSGGDDSAGIQLSESNKWISVSSTRRCTVLDDDLMWHTDACFKKYPFHCSSGNTVEYRETRLNWNNASDNCQSNNMTLITVTKNNTGSIKGSGWIGLQLTADKMWSWSGGMMSDYRNWAAKEPVFENCVVFKEIRPNFHAKDCTKKYAAVCQDDNLMVVKEKKTWEEALNHCRQIDNTCKEFGKDCTYKYDLLSLQDNDYQYVRDRIHRAMTDEVRNFYNG